MSGEPTRARYPDEQGYVERGGVRVFWERYGDGEPSVLFLPAWPLTPARVWKAQIPYLARHARVLAFDARGNGRSDRPTDPESQWPGQYAGDALAVMDAGGVERAVVVGAGPGTQAALLLATAQSERVDGLVLITPDPWPADPYAESFGRGELDHYDDWDRFNPFYWRRDWPGFARWWARTVCALPHSSRQIEDVTQWIAAAEPEALIANAFAMAMTGRESVLALAQQVRCPVLVIYDDEGQIAPGDTWTPLADATGGQLLKIDGANLIGQGRKPVAFNLALRQFVTSKEKVTHA